MYMETSLQKAHRKSHDPETVRGYKEFEQAWRYPRNTQAKLRSMGLPCYRDGKCYFYYPDEVNRWLKEHFKIQRPQLPEPKLIKTAKQ